ncbi:MAG: outer membrane protein assembly factor BamE, partial [Planctomycetes bacterium]|nr:outer membrane protein assembly factor BamE [Planctomycetota bacterium]
HTLTKIEVGMEREQVVFQLGAPTEKIDLADGSQTWRWKSKKTTEREDWAFLIFKNESTTVEEGTTYISFDPDGVVTKCWRD